MDFIKKKIKEKIIHDLETAIAYTSIAYAEKNNSIGAVTNDSTFKYRLFIQEKKSFNDKKKYLISYESKEERYSIKFDSFRKNTINLYDYQDNKIAYIKKEKHNYFKLKENKAWSLFSVYLQNQLLGTIKRNNTFQASYEMTFNNWTIDGQNYIYNQHTIPIARIHHVYDNKYKYLIEMNNRENEIISLLSFMTIELNHMAEDD